MSQAFEIEVYGQRYTIRGDAQETYVQELARQVDERMRTLADKMRNVTPTQLAVLTAINLVNELKLALQEKQAHVEDLNRRAEGLIESIQQTLKTADT